MRFAATVAALWAVGLGLGYGGGADANAAEYLFARVSNARRVVPYAVHLPHGYTAASHRSWPVIVALHGSGQRGSDGVIPTLQGIGISVHKHPEWYEAIVVIPQCPDGLRWNDPDIEALLLEALDHVIARYHGDSRRVALTGYSMGGGGTWEVASAHPERFAVLMPICGVTTPATQAAAVRGKPIWVFHGGADPVVPVRNSRDMVRALRKLGAPSVRYTEYPGVGHGSWDLAYDDPEAIRFLVTAGR